MVNRYIIFKDIQLSTFKTVWKKNKSNCYVTKEFFYNKHLIKPLNIILNFFKNSIEVSPYKIEGFLSGLGDYKIGGVFKFLF